MLPLAVILGILTASASHRDSVYWFAGFRPSHGVAIGIDFVATPHAAGLGCLAAVLVTAAMMLSWRYFERVATYHHALMLTFLAGMAGSCLTGDIFDLSQGALTFAITNSLGSYLTLSGIAVIYGRTGALNMAGGVFYGLGDPPAEDRQMAEQASEETIETSRARRRSPLSMIVPAAALIIGALALTFVPHLDRAVQGMAQRLQDQAGYDRAVPSGAAAASSVPPVPPESAGIRWQRGR